MLYNVLCGEWQGVLAMEERQRERSIGKLLGVRTGTSQLFHKLALLLAKHEVERANRLHRHAAAKHSHFTRRPTLVDVDRGTWGTGQWLEIVGASCGHQKSCVVFQPGLIAVS